jgi:serine/threonine-protein kinase
MIPGAMIGGKYRLLRRLGRGAMGEVWAAVNEDTEREVALKLITSPDPELRRRLKREGRAIGRLEHPHIVQILDLGETAAGEPFLVMQRLSGETLADRLRRDRVLPPAVAAAIALDVARALRAAHDKQIVHRDLKPANIFLHREPDTEDDVVKVVDFGVSKMAVEHEGGGTVTGGIIGSPAYMSPEQIRGVGVDGRTDIWALGVMLFEMVAGSRPFPGMQPVVVLGQILSMPVPRVESVAPHVEPALGDVIAACLERDTDRRVASAADLARQLRPFAPRTRFATVEDPSARDRLTSFTSIPEMLSPLADAAPVKPASDDHATVREVPAPRPIRIPAPAAGRPGSSGLMPAVVRDASPAPSVESDHEGDLPTAVFKPSALLGELAPRPRPAVVVPAPPTPGAGTVRMQPPALLQAAEEPASGEAESTSVFRPAAALRAAAAAADAAPAPVPEEPSTDESVRTTNEIDRTLPRAQMSSFAPTSGSWPKVEASEAPPSSDAPPSAPDPEPEPPADDDHDIDAPTAQMTPEARRKLRTTQPLDPSMVPKMSVVRNLTVPIGPGFIPLSPASLAAPKAAMPNAAPTKPSPGAAPAPQAAPMNGPWSPSTPPAEPWAPAAGQYPATAVTTTTSPLAGPPIEPAALEPPFVLPPGLAPAPRWHTALLVFSAVALVAAVLMLALTLSGDGSAAKAPPAGSSLSDATSPWAPASASASATAPAPSGARR